MCLLSSKQLGREISNHRYQAHRLYRQYFYFCAVFNDLQPFLLSNKMPISDVLNRRVRARHDDDEEVLSEVSDRAEDVPQDDLEEDESDAEDLQSQVHIWILIQDKGPG